MTFVKNSSRLLCNRNFSLLAKIKRQKGETKKRRKFDQTSFSKRERREISFSSDLFSSVIPEKKTSTK